MIGGVLNVIYGIAAIENPSFSGTTRNTSSPASRGWGWTTLIRGILEVLARCRCSAGGLLPVVRHRRRCAGRDRGAAVDPRLSAVVDRGLRPQPVDRERTGRLRRARVNGGLWPVGGCLTGPTERRLCRHRGAQPESVCLCGEPALIAAPGCPRRPPDSSSSLRFLPSPYRLRQRVGLC